MIAKRNLGEEARRRREREAEKRRREQQRRKKRPVPVEREAGPARKTPSQQRPGKGMAPRRPSAPPKRENISTRNPETEGRKQHPLQREMEKLLPEIFDKLPKRNPYEVDPGFTITPKQPLKPVDPGFNVPFEPNPDFGDPGFDKLPERNPGFGNLPGNGKKRPFTPPVRPDESPILRPRPLQPGTIGKPMKPVGRIGNEPATIVELPAYGPKPLSPGGGAANGSGSGTGNSVTDRIKGIMEDIQNRIAKEKLQDKLPEFSRAAQQQEAAKKAAEAATGALGRAGGGKGIQQALQDFAESYRKALQGQTPEEQPNGGILKPAFPFGKRPGPDDMIQPYRPNGTEMPDRKDILKPAFPNLGEEAGITTLPGRREGQAEEENPIQTLLDKLGLQTGGDKDAKAQTMERRIPTDPYTKQDPDAPSKQELIEALQDDAGSATQGLIKQFLQEDNNLAKKLFKGEDSGYNESDDTVDNSGNILEQVWEALGQTKDSFADLFKNINNRSQEWVGEVKQNRANMLDDLIRMIQNPETAKKGEVISEELKQLEGFDDSKYYTIPERFSMFVEHFEELHPGEDLTRYFSPTEYSMIVDWRQEQLMENLQLSESDLANYTDAELGEMMWQKASNMWDDGFEFVDPRYTKALRQQRQDEVVQEIWGEEGYPPDMDYASVCSMMMLKGEGKWDDACPLLTPGQEKAALEYRKKYEEGGDPFLGDGSGAVISSCYGKRNIDGFLDDHEGVDIGGRNIDKKPIASLWHGEVFAVGTEKSRGNYIIIKTTNPDGVESYLWLQHLDEIPNLQKGEPVVPGMELGRVGNSGYSKAAHLHFEVREGSPDGRSVNPSELMPQYAHGTVTEELYPGFDADFWDKGQNVAAAALPYNPENKYLKKK